MLLDKEADLITNDHAGLCSYYVELMEQQQGYVFCEESILSYQ